MCVLGKGGNRETSSAACFRDTHPCDEIQQLLCDFILVRAKPPGDRFEWVFGWRKERGGGRVKARTIAVVENFSIILRAVR